jgi:hypothetical protein
MYLSDYKKDLEKLNKMFLEVEKTELTRGDYVVAAYNMITVMKNEVYLKRKLGNYKTISATLAIVLVLSYVL